MQRFSLNFIFLTWADISDKSRATSPSVIQQFRHENNSQGWKENATFILEHWGREHDMSVTEYSVEKVSKGAEISLETKATVDVC